MDADREEAAGGPRLSPRQRLFVTAYIVDGDATAAAIRAGYSRAGAARTGQRLERLPRVRQAIDRARQSGGPADRLDRDRVIEELARIAFADIRDFLSWDAEGVHLKPMDELTREQTACVAEIVESGGKTGKGLRVKLHGKLAALSALNRLLGGESRQDEALPRQLVVVTAVPDPAPPPGPAGTVPSPWPPETSTLPAAEPPSSGGVP